MTSGHRSRIRALAALAALVVLGGATGLIVGAASPVTYTATGTVFVSEHGVQAAPAVPGEPTPFAQQVRDSYVGVATSPIVLRPVIDRLQLTDSVPELARRIDVEEPSGTALLRISATDSTPVRAARIVNAVQDRLASVATGLTPNDGASPRLSLVPVVRASPPTTSAGPSAALLALAGALLGAAVWGVVVIVLLIIRMPRPPRGTPAPSML